MKMSGFQLCLLGILLLVNYISTQECGRVKVQSPRTLLPRTDPDQNNWPWMVAFFMRDAKGVQVPWCSGFLIDKRHVLSAAHCFERNERKTLYMAIIGQLDQSQGIEYTIQRIVVHPGYVPGYFYDDIALLTLTRPVRDPKFVQICLPSSREFMNLTGMGTTAVGWGSTRNGGEMSMTLKELSGVTVISNFRCNQALKKAWSSFREQFPKGISSGIICAGFMEEGGKDNCDGGDSGGPLMFKYRDQWYAVGIESFGYSCGMRGFPGGYTRVSAYVTWIESKRNDV